MNQDFNEVVDVVVEGAKAYKAAKADGKVDLMDLMLVLPLLLKLPAAIKGAPDAFKGLDAAAIKEAAIKILDAAGEHDGKVGVYVEEVFSILGNGIEIFASVQKIAKA